MNHMGKKRLFLLGLDEGLLWQLTRTLAAMAGDIEYSSASSLSEASDLIRDREFNLIVVDGAEMGMRVLQSMPNTNTHPLPRLLVLTEQSSPSLPQEMLLPDDTLFLERPFNTKEFPFFVLKALEESHAYAPLPPPAQPVERRLDESDASRPDVAEDFYYYFAQGFSCISRQDLVGAREHWLRARSLRPEDRRVQINLARLEKMINNQS